MADAMKITLKSGLWAALLATSAGHAETLCDRDGIELQGTARIVTYEAGGVEAERRALGECGDQCRVVMRFSGECVAFAADQEPESTIYGWATSIGDVVELVELLCPAILSTPREGGKN